MTTRPLTFAILSSALLLSACARSTTLRTSADTAIVQTSAAPVCGGTGAATVAQKQAAIETIKAGYDRYMIVDTAAANNVGVAQLPGSYQTTGFVKGGYVNATTTYRPGPTMVYGTHDQALAIRMFHDSDPGASRAVSARQVLGDKWQEAVKAGAVRTCS
jgi:hypothetical protein